MSKTDAMHWVGPEGLHPFLTPLSELTEYQDNERLHDDKNLGAIEESLKVHGQVRLLVAYKGEVFAGNGRLAVMKRMGWTHAAVLDGVFESRESARAFAIADNRTAELSSWTTKVLAERLAGLPDELLPSTGFEQVEWTVLKAAHLGWKTKAEHPEEPKPKASIDTFSVRDWNIISVVKDAIALLRKREGDPSMLEGRALELIAAEYLS
jgi:hypothetical protein